MIVPAVPAFNYVALLATICLFAFGCSKPTESHTEEPQDEHSAEEEAGHSEDIVLTSEAAKIAGIETGTAGMRQMQGELKVAGVVTNTGKGLALVTPPVAGRITRLLAAVGDSVNAGQPIAILESSDLAIASGEVSRAQQGILIAKSGVQEANAQVDLARGKLRTAQQTVTRQQQLAKAGAFSQAPLQAAQQQLNEAEAELKSAKAEEVVHKAQIERAERLYAQELISRSELEQAKLELTQDMIRQERASQQIAIAKQAFARETEISEKRLLVSREVQAAEGDARAANLELQQARIKLKSAQAAVATAARGLTIARSSYAALSGNAGSGGSTFTVVAAISGIIADRKVTIGQAVDRGEEICEIENLDSVWVTASVPEKVISKAIVGATADVRVASFPNRVFTGSIQVVSNRLDPKSRTMPVQVLVVNRDGALRTDMFATVTLGVGANASVLTVPNTAIIDDGDRKVLYVAEEEGKYEERAVQIGRTTKGLTEILSGLEAGTKIVTKGAFALKSEKQKAELKGHEH